MSTRTKIFSVIAIILLAASSRLVEHPFNFTPIAAMALFAGCYLRAKWGVLIPLAAMAIGDYFIGFYEWQVMASVYFGITAAYLIGWVLSKRVRWYNVAFSSLVSSIVFFLLTNFSVWAFFSWYPHTWAGLVNCFTLALPFFRNTIAGDLVYSVVLFGAFELVMVLAARKKLATERA
ncbi:MAG: hypothetical protein PHQ47_01715 [Candidatus Portnoybacteria bacterium]|nr:hypothetical protein [Candidatus Portnoybacteria bacterium]